MAKVVVAHGYISFKQHISCQIHSSSPHRAVRGFIPMLPPGSQIGFARLREQPSHRLPVNLTLPLPHGHNDRNSSPLDTSTLAQP